LRQPVSPKRRLNCQAARRDFPENVLKIPLFTEEALTVISVSVLSKSKQTKQTPWPESTNDLCRPSDRRLSAKLMPTFVDRGVSRSQRCRFSLGFLDRSRYFSFQEAERTPFQTHCFSENQADPRLEPRPLTTKAVEREGV
jgi:hypothetical protein